MGDKEIISIEKFQDASQWMAWRFQIRVILTAADAFGVVNGDDAMPTDTSDDEHENKLREWKKKDAKAQKIIVTSIGQKVMIHILNCTTSKQMWDKLKSIYEQDNSAAKHLLHQQFFSYEKRAEDDVATHISKLEGIVQKLKNMSVEISNDMMITKISMTLPQEYRYFVSAWESSTDDQRTLTNLTNRLLVEESRLGVESMSLVKSESSEAFLAKQAGGAFKKFEQHKKKNKKKGNCFKCGSSEHWKNNCPSNKSTSNDTKSKSYGSNDKAFFSGVVNDLKGDEIWYQDSGASNHMSNQRSWFVNFTTLDMNNQHEITLANGDVMRATGKGDINILSFNGQD